MLTKTNVAALAALACLMLTSQAMLRAQVSTDEAQRRLAEKQSAARAPATQPADELQRLRAENRRLRIHVLSLEEEINTLKQALAQADKANPGAATRPAAEAPPQSALAGRWRGGNITTGAGYILDFAANGVYKQTFIASDQQDVGHFTAAGDTLQMWSNKAPEDRKHNQYHFTLSDGQLTLTPIIADGVQVKHARPVVLKRAE